MSNTYDPHKKGDCNPDRFPDGPAMHVRPYRREEELPKLIGLWPDEIAGHEAADANVVLGKLRRALRAERQRGRAGHWAYDLNRHLALLDAIRHETALMKQRVRRVR